MRIKQITWIKRIIGEFYRYYEVIDDNNNDHKVYWEGDNHKKFVWFRKDKCVD